MKNFNIWAVNFLAGKDDILAMRKRATNASEGLAAHNYWMTFSGLCREEAHIWLDLPKQFDCRE